MKALSLLFLSAAAIASADIINGSFELPKISGYQYQSPIGPGAPQLDLNSTPGVGWTFGLGSGLTENGTAFNPPSITNGTQAAFLQSTGWVSQTFYLGVGTHTLSFDLAGRGFGCCSGDQNVLVTINGTASVYSELFGTTTGSVFATTSRFFNVATAGNYTLTFAGQFSEDRTAFLDNVSLPTASAPVSSVPEPTSIAVLAAGLGLVSFASRKRIA